MRRASVAATWRGLLVAIAAIALPVGTAPAHADSIRDNQWHLKHLNVAEAHLRTQGERVTVAVLDSGVDASHPDLVGSVRPALSAVGVDTRVDGAEGARSDPEGRGTGRAGLIAGHGHGSGGADGVPGSGGADGVLGLAPRATVLPVTVSRPGGVDDPDAMARGIRLAVRHGATVICVGRSVPDSPLLRAAVGEALRADVVVVAVAGDLPGAYPPASFPAAYPGVLVAVPHGRDAAVTPPATPPSSSARGLALAVPGDMLYTANAGGGYRIDFGAGAPAVLAGAVALVRSAYPGLAAGDVVHRLTATAADAGAPGPDPVYGAGLLDLVAALVRAVPARPASSAAASPRPGASGPGSTAPGRPRGRLGWLVAAPLVGVLGGLGWYAVRGARIRP